MLNTRSNHLVIVIATHNRLDMLRRTLASIAFGTKCSHEVIVADAGSTDGTVEYLGSADGVTAVLQGQRIGTSRAYNQVWRDVECRFTCWLSDDTEVVPGQLDLAVSILDRHPFIGMVGLKMKDVVGPYALRAYMGALSSYGVLNCNHGVLSMELLKAVGYFNESYRSGMIDPDLTASVLCAGRSVVMTKRISVLHHRAYVEQWDHQAFVQAEAGGIDNERIYREKFAFLKNAERLPSWKMKTLLTRRFAKHLFPKFWREDRRRFGFYPRHWVNLLCSKFIRLSDPVEHLGRPYHLAQCIPGALLAARENPYSRIVHAATAAGLDVSA